MHEYATQNEKYFNGKQKQSETYYESVNKLREQIKNAPLNTSS